MTSGRSHRVSRPRRPPPAAPRGPQRRRRRSSASRSGSRPRRGWARSTRELQSLVKREGLHTVCQEAGCPNIFECWEDREATFLIGGDQCTRRCDFCQIDTGKPAAARPRRAAPGRRVACRRWACATPPSPASPATTSPDEGAWLYAETVRADPRAQPRHRRRDPRSPTSPASPSCSQQVFDAAPEVFAHNVETVPRIFKRIRPGVPLRALARTCITQGRARRPGHQVQPDPRHGRDPRGGLPGAARPARGRLRPGHHHPVPAPLRRGTTRSSAGSSRRSSSSCSDEADGDRLRRRDVRAAGALVVPRRPALGQAMRRRGEELPPALAHLAEAGTARQEAAGLLGA